METIVKIFWRVEVEMKEKVAYGGRGQNGEQNFQPQ